MGILENKINDLLTFEFQRLAYENRGYLEWAKCKNIIENRIIPLVNDIYSGTIVELEEENRKLKATINRHSFRTVPERDKKIIELFGQGLSFGKIAKSVGMSKWGVSKALRRLGVN